MKNFASIKCFVEDVIVTHSKVFFKRHFPCNASVSAQEMHISCNSRLQTPHTASIILIKLHILLYTLYVNTGQPISPLQWNRCTFNTWGYHGSDINPPEENFWSISSFLFRNQFKLELISDRNPQWGRKSCVCLCERQALNELSELSFKFLRIYLFYRAESSLLLWSSAERPVTMKWSAIYRMTLSLIYR